MTTINYLAKEKNDSSWNPEKICVENLAPLVPNRVLFFKRFLVSAPLDLTGGVCLGAVTCTSG